MNHQQNDESASDDTEAGTRPNKSAQKRQMRELQATGTKLLALPKARLAELPLSGDLNKALAEGRRLKHADAIRRQIRYIAKLIKSADHETIVAAIDKQEDNERLFRQRFQQAKALGERLSAGDQGLLEQVLDEHPQLERQRLRQLIRQVNKEFIDKDDKTGENLTGAGDADQQRTASAQRKLFDYLRQNLGAD